MFTAFDPLLIATALLIMVVGTRRRWSFWRKGRSENRPGDWKGLSGYLLFQKKILKGGWGGIAHMVLFWGVLIPLVVIVLAQFAFVMRPGPAHALAFILDLAGAAAMAGVLFFLVRRAARSFKTSGVSSEMPWPAALLFLILLSGFIAQGTRLNLVPAPFWTAPVGWLFSRVSPSSPLALQLAIRLHFFAVLGLFALLPFTSLRHVPAGALNVYYRRKGPRGVLRPVSFEKGPLGAKSTADLTWKQLLEAEACVSCGRCEQNCPAFLSGKKLSPRNLMGKIFKQLEAPESSLAGEAVSLEEIWSCTTCMACVAHCPLYIEPMDKVVDMRRYEILGKGAAPVEARPMLRDLELFGDVNGKGISRRTDWALNLGVPILSATSEQPQVLLWIGCSGAFHPKYRETARNMVKILKRAGVSFAILGGEEGCCGDPARRLGEESLFLDLARKNILRWQRHCFKKIVALCPHCFNTLKNEYPVVAEKMGTEARTEIEVVHASEFLLNIIEGKQITLKYPVKGQAAIHDPCYLGRANGIYAPLRKIVKAIPGLSLRELERSGEKGFCCGGGGGGMWLHETKGVHINGLRAAEIAGSGVGLVSTACPYCLTMLEDGLNALELERPIKVEDIIDIVSGSLG